MGTSLYKEDASWLLQVYVSYFTRIGIHLYHSVHFSVWVHFVSLVIARSNEFNAIGCAFVQHTKPCPRCKNPIQKNNGCDHMTCRCMSLNRYMWICVDIFHTHAAVTTCAQAAHSLLIPTTAAGGCGFEFCWICLGDYHCHNSANCSYVHPETRRFGWTWCSLVVSKASVSELIAEIMHARPPCFPGKHWEISVSPNFSVARLKRPPNSSRCRPNASKASITGKRRVGHTNKKNCLQCPSPSACAWGSASYQFLSQFLSHANLTCPLGG